MAPDVFDALAIFWRPVFSWFLSAASAASPKIQNPWGGKSMGWEILGKSMSKSRIFGNPDFTKKSRFENELVVFHNVIKVF